MGRLERIDDITVDAELQARLQAPLGSLLAPIRHLDGDIETDGWARFLDFTLSGRDLFLNTDKVLADGMVECENDLDINGSVVEDETAVAKDLPIPQRRYNGVFRTPPRTSIEPGNTEDVAQ
jgi:hypothetical protein